MRVPAHLGYRKRKPKAVTTVLAIASRLVIATAAVYLVVTTFLLSSVRVDSTSMEPALAARDRLFVSPLVYGPRIPFTGWRIPGYRAPERGDVVLLLSPQAADQGPVLRALDGVVRFFTVQRVTISGMDRSGAAPRLIVKRIIGLPGDTVRMVGYAAEVKPAGESLFAGELAISRRVYEPRIGSRAALPEAAPFGGGLPEVVLGKGQFFLLGDNREDSSDSRSWGPVGMERFMGAVMVRYFPFRRLGRV